MYKVAFSVKMGLLGVFGLEAALALFFVPWRAYTGPPWIAFLAFGALLGTLAGVAFALSRRERNAQHPGGEMRWTEMLVPVLVGGLLRLAWARAFPCVLYSDYLDYWDAARRLVAEGRYCIPFGQVELVAWRPVGVPGVLAAGMLVAGEDLWLPAAMNLVAYVAAYFFLVDQARQAFGRCGAMWMAWAVALCPSMIFGSGYPGTELPALALLSGFCWAAARSLAGGWKAAVLAGLLLAGGTMFKPGFMLMPLAWLLCLLLSKARWRRVILCFVPFAAGFTVAMCPWTIRNYHQLGAFVPVSTNGGSVFYFSNNPLASGTWAARGERDLYQYIGEEARWSQMGYKWGKEWIRDHPVEFAKLAFYKQSYLFSDNPGTFLYYSLERPHGIDSGAFYWSMRAIGLAWWVGLWVLVGASVLVRGRSLLDVPITSLSMLVVLATALTHSVYESQPRHLTPALGALFLVALAAVSGKPGRLRDEEAKTPVPRVPATGGRRQLGPSRPSPGGLHGSDIRPEPPAAGACEGLAAPGPPRVRGLSDRRFALCWLGGKYPRLSSNPRFERPS